MKRIFYFAYGSNLSHDRLLFRIGKWKSETPFELPNYKLMFNVAAHFISRENFIRYKMGPTFANIMPFPGASVQGIMYEINGQQLKILNQIEGLYQQAFFDVPFDNAIGVTYVGIDDYIGEGRPELSYINVILEGAAEKGLQDTYRDVLKYKFENFKLKKGSKHKPL